MGTMRLASRGDMIAKSASTGTTTTSRTQATRYVFRTVIGTESAMVGGYSIFRIRERTLWVMS